MEIGVIADTHLAHANRLLVKAVEEHFKNADLILHAGDLTSMAVLDAFKGKEIVAVAGNSDSREIRQRLSKKEVITAGGYRIGLIHGWGSPVGIEKRVASSFDEDVQCVIFGHSHRAVNHMRDEILYFNPGSFSGGLFSLWKSSIGILTIDREIHARIIRL